MLQEGGWMLSEAFLWLLSVFSWDFHTKSIANGLFLRSSSVILMKTQKNQHLVKRVHVHPYTASTDVDSWT